MSAFDRHAERLDVLRGRGRGRVLAQARGLDFASNDYLGLAASDVLRDRVTKAIVRGVPVGASGSRLLRGNDPEHGALESEAARFFGVEAALYMGGGFQANQAVFATMPMADDLVVYDALIHASAHEGLRLGRAKSGAFHHNDCDDLHAKIAAWRATGGRGRVWIAVESVYSMEGDFAPLGDIADVARRHEAVLIVDEAHATGLYGVQGRGLVDVADVPVIAVHTCGKALGASGALICGDKVVIETLVNQARPFIFATAPSPLMAAAVRGALDFLSRHDEPRERAAKLRRHAQARAKAIGMGVHGSQILPVLVGADQAAVMAARRLQDAGFDVRAIRPPTVPKGTARLRVSVTGGITIADIDALFDEISAMKSEGVL